MANKLVSEWGKLYNEDGILFLVRKHRLTNMNYFLKGEVFDESV